MKKDGLFKLIVEGLYDTCYIWREELRQVLKDEGVLIFFIIVPIAYPLLYSWIYNNEVVREVPVVVVDNAHSHMSRDFIRRCDASPDVKIAYHASDMDEAKMLMGKELVEAVYYIPSDFQSRLNRMEQSTVSVFCDMSMMLTYKAAYMTAMAVSQEMNSEIQIKLSGKYTKREEELQVQPLAAGDVPIFSPAGGYGSGLLPAVLMLILQQTLVLGIGMSAGTARESNRSRDLVPIQKHYHGMFRIVFGKTLCYFMIYALMGTWLTVVVPRIFHFPCLGHWDDLLAIMIPYILACIFFGMMISCLARYRENVMLLIVFMSVPLLFLSGVSWPQSSMPGAWRSVACLFPSTFGVRGFVRLNSMGATLADIELEYKALWIQTTVYFFATCLVYRYQIIQARNHAVETIKRMQEKLELNK